MLWIGIPQVSHLKKEKRAEFIRADKIKKVILWIKDDYSEIILVGSDEPIGKIRVKKGLELTALMNLMRLLNRQDMLYGVFGIDERGNMITFDEIVEMTQGVVRRGNKA